MVNSFLKTVLLCFGLAPLAMSQATTADDTNASCIEKLQMPVYPVLAKQARLWGTFTVSVTLDPDASVQTVSSEMESNVRPSRKAIFVPALEKSIRESSFAHGCGGKTVTLVFQFVLGTGAPTDHGQDVSFGFPNRFWISTPPPVMNP
jgi:hypothetical protein